MTTDFAESIGVNVMKIIRKLFIYVKLIRFSSLNLYS